MLRRVALIAAPAGGVTPYGGEGGGAPPPPPAALVSPPPPLPQLPQADVKVEVRQYLYLRTSKAGSFIPASTFVRIAAGRRQGL